MSKLITIIATALIMPIASFTLYYNPDRIVGTYWSPKKDAKIAIYKRGNSFFGKSIWIANPGKDSHNPNKALQSRDLLGIELLSGFSYEDGTYTNGTIYDPESGNTYKCKITFEGNNLKVRGYIGISLFGRTEIFERVSKQ